MALYLLNPPDGLPAAFQVPDAVMAPNWSIHVPALTVKAAKPELDWRLKGPPAVILPTATRTWLPSLQSIEGPSASIGPVLPERAAIPVTYA
mgnify:CR=1 FL=1